MCSGTGFLKNVYNADQIVVEVKRLKEFNKDCDDLGCSNKKCENEKGLICLYEKKCVQVQGMRQKKWDA